MPSPMSSELGSLRMIAPAEEVATLWVGNVLPGTSDDELSFAFSPFGTLLACFLVKKLSPQGQMSGFVRYTSRGEAALALQACESEAVMISGAPVRAHWASENSKVTRRLSHVDTSHQP